MGAERFGPTRPWLRSRAGLALLALLAIAGFFLAAQQSRQLATTGPYAHVRHPQYDGFILITGVPAPVADAAHLVMVPILACMYVRLAGREEREARVEFGEAYARCAAATPAFLPRLRRAPARRRA